MKWNKHTSLCKKNGQCLGSSNEGVGCIKDQYTYDSQKEKKII